MAKKEIEVVIFSDDLSKIKRKKIKFIPIVLLFVLIISSIVFGVHSKGVYQKIKQNIQTVQRLDSSINLANEDYHKLNSDFDNVARKLSIIDSLKKDSKDKDAVLLPSLYDKKDSSSINFLFNDSIEVDVLLANSKKKLMILTTLTENFNNNPQGIKQYPSKYPVKSRNVIRKFKKYKDPMTQTVKMHRGIDFAGKKGENVVATAEGIVNQVGKEDYFGNYIRINHNDSISSFYSHLNSTKVKVGDKVSKGEVIAEIGNTGVSTSHHLHFEIWLNNSPIDPMLFLIEDK